LRGLAQSELDIAQGAEAEMYLRGFDASDDPLASEARIVDDDCDRLHALGDTSGGRATAPSQLGKLGAQLGVHAIEEPRGDVATTFVRREAKPTVTADLDVHPSADERPVTIGASPCVALLLGNHGAEQTASGPKREPPAA
jgi:hypothetical protein